MVRKRAVQSEETQPVEDANEEITIGDAEEAAPESGNTNGNGLANGLNEENAHATNDQEAEGDFQAGEAEQTNGAVKTETKDNTTSKVEDHASNDSACVLQELSYRRVSIPMLAKNIYNQKTGELLGKYTTHYNIHVPRPAKVEEDKELFGMIDCECANSSDADSLITEMNEAFSGKVYGGNNSMLAKKWPESKQFYNDYEYLDEVPTEIKARFKEGMLTAGLHKLETHFVALRNIPTTLSVEQAIEQTEGAAVDGFKTMKGDRIYLRCDSRDATTKLHNKKIKIDEKNFAIRPLTPHPNQKKGYQGGPQNRGANQYQGNRGAPNNFNYQGGYRGGYMGGNQGNYQGGPNPHYGGSWGPQQYGGHFGHGYPQGPAYNQGPGFDSGFRRNPPQGNFNNSKRVRY